MNEKWDEIFEEMEKLLRESRELRDLSEVKLKALEEKLRQEKENEEDSSWEGFEGKRAVYELRYRKDGPLIARKAFGWYFPDSPVYKWQIGLNDGFLNLTHERVKREYEFIK